LIFMLLLCYSRQCSSKRVYHR